MNPTILPTYLEKRSTVSETFPDNLFVEKLPSSFIIGQFQC